MKKMIKHTVFFLVVIVTLSPVLGQAFNPAAHVYIAGKVAKQVFPFTFDKINLYYGSIAPDISSYADIGDWPNGFCETHYGFTKLPYAWWNPIQKAFAQGWQIHSEIGPWGADYYAHWAHGYFGSCPFVPQMYDGYVPAQARILAANFSLNEDLAHFAIEVAIDILLVDDKDHALGEKLLSAALFRSSEDVRLLAKVFVDRQDGAGTDWGSLSSAESTFRNLVINYATALTLPDPLRMALLGEIGVQVASALGATELDSDDVQAILMEAIDLCRATNYYGPVDEAIKGIINNKSKLIK
jgi:hypothetical protein